MTSSAIERSTTENMSRSTRVFLSAEWRDLVMLNYVVEPSLLNRYVPTGTSLDSFQGKTYLSLVGFRFCRTKLLGRFPVPWNTDFDEVNLRFYVRRKQGSDERRGVVFIAEVVPKWAIAATARLLYGENYTCLPMRHSIGVEQSRKKTAYEWKLGTAWCKLSAETTGLAAHPPEASLQQFITEYYWGYSTQRAAGCLEYHVSHAPWQVWAAAIARFEGDASALYGAEFAAVLKQSPDCAFLADGSPITVFRGNRIH